MSDPTKKPPAHVTQPKPAPPAGKQSSQKSSPSVQVDSDPHSLLSTTPYNVRLNPRNAIHTVYETVGMHPMRTHAPNQIRLVSEYFPWPIDIHRKQPVTCGDVWKELYEQLHHPITENDWAHIVHTSHDDLMRRAVIKAYDKRVPPEDRSVEPLRRIDYLRNRTFFIGLEKDDAYVKKTLMPGPGEKKGQGPKKEPETWVANFAKST